MIEMPTDRRTRAALRSAREERARAARNIWHWMFGARMQRDPARQNVREEEKETAGARSTPY
jgi:hypothetical protein